MTKPIAIVTSNRRAPQDPRRLSIQLLEGDFSDRRFLTLRQFGCCCCCCCIQMPVNTAFGLVVAGALPGIGQLPSFYRRPWPVRARLIGAGGVIGMIQGSVATVMWPGWDRGFHVYLLGVLFPAALAMALAILAARLDRPHRDRLGAPPRHKQAFATVAVLGAALGSLLISACFAFDGGTAHAGGVNISIGASAAVGCIIGIWLVRHDQGGSLHPEPSLMRLTGGLVGANVLSTVAGLLWAIRAWHNDWQVWPVLAGVLVAAGWSRAVCSAKARNGGWPTTRALSALVAATDGLAGGALAFLGIAAWEEFRWDRGWVTGFAAFVAGGVTWWALARRTRAVGTRSVGVDEHALFCPNCGYNLTGLPSERCPECGRLFDVAKLRLAWHPGMATISTWHPVSTSPVGGSLVGLCAMLVVVLIIAGIDYLW